MNTRLEIRWMLCLLGTLLLSYGLLTDFRFVGPMDIHRYDTYYIFENLPLLLPLAVVFILSCVLSITLKWLSGMNGTLQWIAILILTVLGLVFLGLMAMTFVGFWAVFPFGGDLTMFGLLVLFGGLGGLFVGRAIEIVKANK